MPVPTDITTLSTTAGSNSPSGSEGASAGDDHIRQIYAFIASLRDNPTANGADWKVVSSVLQNPTNTQTAFSAYLSANQTSGTTVIFNTENYDQGSGYDNATGIFTAPVAGVYVFAASVTVFNNKGSDRRPYIGLTYNGGSALAYSTSYCPTGFTSSPAVTAMYRLSVGNTVRVGVSTESAESLAANLYALGGVFTSFSGYLLG